MDHFFQEFSGYHGTLVKPYYWLYQNQGCSKCPYHIKTGEESRVTYGEFYETFGFPYGPTMPENKQLIFYEIKDFSGAVLQRGQVTNCVSANIHAESILFEEQGYLDTFLYHHDYYIGYITLYSNYTPCNEYAHYCISKMDNFIAKYPQIRLDIYFSQLYHTEASYPTALWNREALRSLAGHWPRVTLNPLSNGIWKNVLYTFVKEVPETTMYQPILPARSSTDSHNAYMIQVITGIKPYFVDVPPQPKPIIINQRQERPKANYNPNPQPQTNSYQYPPYFAPGMQLVPLPGPVSHAQNEVTSKPKNIVRHLKMPMDKYDDVDLGTFLPNAKKINEVVITEKVVKEKDKENVGNRKKRRKNGP
ncbi:putative C-_U-editing enzyme APOBEC-4 [Spea bombifrons]|uniref:putative C->U-editing enzyme APOBEC-4 n=1 Tax=Spea bombifrons TaxID=233779 RepID=UPI00234B46BE|nr:putative C->U-editing enzyme APOBEC-4 [Spea bombifrons]